MDSADDSGLRRRRPLTDATVSQAADIVKQFDAFPKAPEECIKSTTGGGSLALVAFAAIAGLVIFEVLSYFTESHLRFDYQVIPDNSGEIKVNLDIVVATSCDMLGVDAVDFASDGSLLSGDFRKQPVHFDMRPQHRLHYDAIRRQNEFLLSEYHAVHKIVWTGSRMSVNTSTIADRDASDSEAEDLQTPKMACRLLGSANVRRISGNLHIVIGMAVNFFGQHAHAAPFFGQPGDQNFSHRINHLSFGEITPGVVYPFDGEERIVYESQHMFQYFIEVLPTAVRTRKAQVKTYQMSVTDRNRTVDHDQGSHGVPGIYFKYDLSPIEVHVRESHISLFELVLRLIGIIGGIHATCCMLNRFLDFAAENWACAAALRRRRTAEELQNQPLLT